MPPMEFAKEMALVAAAQAGDSSARSALYAMHHRWIVCQAKRYETFGVPLDDLIQAGAEGWCVGLARFDGTRGVRSLTYLTHWITRFILEAIPAYCRTVTVKDNSRGSAFKRIARGDYHQDRSLHSKAGPLGEETHLDMMPSHEPSPEAALRLAESTINVAEVIRCALLPAPNARKRPARMAIRELELVRRRILADKPERLSAISKDWGVSRERARATLVEVTDKLRAAM